MDKKINKFSLQRLYQKYLVLSYNLQNASILHVIFWKTPSTIVAVVILSSANLLGEA